MNCSELGMNSITVLQKKKNESEKIDNKTKTFCSNLAHYWQISSSSAFIIYIINYYYYYYYYLFDIYIYIYLYIIIFLFIWYYYLFDSIIDEQPYCLI